LARNVATAGNLKTKEFSPPTSSLLKLQLQGAENKLRSDVPKRKEKIG